MLTELNLEPPLRHPPAIKVLAKNEAKADRCDADRLGRFWLKGIFSESYPATSEVRQIRERLRHRHGAGCDSHRREEPDSGHLAPLGMVALLLPSSRKLVSYAESSLMGARPA